MASSNIEPERCVMKSFRLLLPAACLAAALAAAAPPDAPPPTPPDAETLKAITNEAEKLRKQIDHLRSQGVGDPVLADIEIYHKAAEWVLKHNEFTRRRRPRRGARGPRPRPAPRQPGGPRRSAVARPDRLRPSSAATARASTAPCSPTPSRCRPTTARTRRRWRLDVVLHGRNDDLTEVRFLHQHNGDHPAPADQNCVQIDIYGRGNNAYRWAGETDVERGHREFPGRRAGAGTRRADRPQPRRAARLLDGRGGHVAPRPALGRSQWCVIGPGAGFTTTHGYVKNLPDKLPPYQEACLQHLRRRRLRRERLRRSRRRLRRRRRPAIAGGPQHRGEAQAARHPHDTAGGAGAGARVPRRVAEERPRREYEKYTTKGRQEYPHPRPLRHLHAEISRLRLGGDRSGWTHHYQRAPGGRRVGRQGRHGARRTTSASCTSACRRAPSASRRPSPSTARTWRSRPIQFVGRRRCQLYLEKRDGKWVRRCRKGCSRSVCAGRRRRRVCKGRSTTPSRRRSCACAAPASLARGTDRLRQGQPRTLPRRVVEVPARRAARQGRRRGDAARHRHAAT